MVRLGRLHKRIPSPLYLDIPCSGGFKMVVDGVYALYCRLSDYPGSSK